MTRANPWRPFILPALLGVAATLAGVALAGASGRLIARAALRPEVFLSLTLLVTLVRGLGVGRAGLRYAERLTGHAAALKAGEAQRAALFDRVARFGRDLLARERGGDLLARSGADLDARQFAALRVTLPLLGFVGAAFLAGGWLLRLDARLGLSLLGPLLLAAALPWLARTRVAELTRQEARLSREHDAALLDALGASADGASRLWAPPLAELSAGLRQVTEAQGRLQTCLTLGREALFALSFTLVLTRGLTLVEAGALGGAWLAAVVLLAAASFDAVTPLALIPGAHAAAQAARERDDDLAAVQPAVTDPAVPSALPPGPLLLTLDGVSVTRGRRELLRDVTLPLPPGARVAVTGPSGAGKSTLLGLISRDLDPTTGQVTLGGTDLRALALENLRARLSLHEQDAPLLDGTVEENLRLGGPHAPPERLRALLDDLDLGELALDTWVGEGGTRLSGGQRARVSLARALLKRSDVLLLDEPTAHLDPDTESRVLRVIDRECAGRTLLLVTHRPAPLTLADQVYRLQDGHLHPLPAPHRKVI